MAVRDSRECQRTSSPQEAVMGAGRVYVLRGSMMSNVGFRVARAVWRVGKLDCSEETEGCN